VRNTDLCAQAVLSSTWRQKPKLTHNALPHKKCSQKRDRCRLSNKQLTTHMQDSHHGKGCSGARAHTNLTHCAKAGRTWEDAACSSCRHGSLKYRPKAWPSTPDTPIFHSASEGQRTNTSQVTLSHPHWNPLCADSITISCATPTKQAAATLPHPPLPVCAPPLPPLGEVVFPPLTRPTSPLPTRFSSSCLKRGGQQEPHTQPT
jgi:hypothetical protein